jgi:hypothetical protein
VQTSVQTVVSQSRVELVTRSLGGKLVLGPGFRDEPDPELLAASLGELKERSEGNNCWALRQANLSRARLG